MQCKKYGRTIAVRISRGEELVSALRDACVKEGVKFGFITGIGAVDHAVVSLYRVTEKKYYPSTFDEDMEMTALNGSITEMDGSPYLHLHVGFAGADGRAVGGHLKEAVVSGTGEVFIQIVDGTMDRRPDPETGLNLFDL